MGKWQKVDMRKSLYRQTVDDGFILTQGCLDVGFNDSPFSARPIFPSFQLLRVHKNRPISVVDNGRIRIRPEGDTRLVGQILRDKNPNVYDAVSFVLVPYKVQLPADYPGEVFANFDGFVNSDGRRNLASLVYINERELEIDGQYVNTVSTVMPSQIRPHFENWLYHAGVVQAYDEKAPFGQGWKDIGRFDLRNVGGVGYTAVQHLEKRFKTRLLTEGSSID